VTCLVLAALFHVGCSSTSFEGVPTDITYESTAEGGEIEGTDWTVTSLLLAPTAVEIVPCSEAETTLSTAASFVSKHVESTPFQNGLSTVWPVVGHGEQLYSGGGLEPPIDEYCEVRVLLVPLDDDAVRGEGFPELAGLTLHLEGHGTESAAERVIESSLRAEARVQFDNAPVLIESASELRLRVDLEQLLDSVDAGDSDEEVGRSILTNLPQALSAHVEEAAVE
jgi:hypothetical protein